MKGSRTQKSVTNTVVSFASQLIVILLGFLSRRVLIYSVGVEYLGINGLMSNILTIFSLAESGIGLAIGYALYKPLAENDIEQVKSLMRFFKYTYRALAIGTAAIGIAFYPLLPFFLKDNTAPDANLVYWLFLLGSVSSYLWVYKTTLNTSDQNKYLYTIASTIAQIVVLVLKVLILYFVQNYILYLAVDIGTTIVKNLIFCRIVDRRYPYLKDKNVRKLDPGVRKSLFTNIKALFLGKVGYIISQCSDNLVISSLVSVTAVGMYSNYTTLITSVSGFVTTFSSGVTASMGNLIASETKERAYEVYKRVDFINYWLYTFTATCLLCRDLAGAGLCAHKGHFDSGSCDILFQGDQLRDRHCQKRGRAVLPGPVYPDGGSHCKHGDLYRSGKAVRHCRCSVWHAGQFPCPVLLGKALFCLPGRIRGLLCQIRCPGGAGDCGFRSGCRWNVVCGFTGVAGKCAAELWCEGAARSGAIQRSAAVGLF